MGHFGIKAQPGVLDIVFKTANVKESIITNQNNGDVVLISIFDEKNQIVYQANHLISNVNKVYCDLPRGKYKIVITDVYYGSKILVEYIKLE